MPRSASKSAKPGGNEPLKSAFADDPEMAELIAYFLQEIPSRVDAIREALEEGDHERVASLAHQLKGAGGGYGFPTISEAAAALERAAQERADANRVRSSADILFDVCRRAAA